MRKVSSEISPLLLGEPLDRNLHVPWVPGICPSSMCGFHSYMRYITRFLSRWNVRRICHEIRARLAYFGNRAIGISIVASRGHGE